MSLKDIINKLPDDYPKDSKIKVCLDCSRKQPLKCNYCNDKHEWPKGQSCSMCGGTGYRK